MTEFTVQWIIMVIAIGIGIGFNWKRFGRIWAQKDEHPIKRTLVSVGWVSLVATIMMVALYGWMQLTLVKATANTILVSQDGRLLEEFEGPHYLFVLDERLRDGAQIESYEARFVPMTVEAELVVDDPLVRTIRYTVVFRTFSSIDGYLAMRQRGLIGRDDTVRLPPRIAGALGADFVYEHRTELVSFCKEDPEDNQWDFERLVHGYLERRDLLRDPGVYFDSATFNVS